MNNYASKLTNHTAQLENQFNQLNYLYVPEYTRLELLKEICSKQTIQHFVKSLNYITRDDFLESVKPYIAVSGAGMIKIKLFTHPFGKIRLHIRPKINIIDNEESIGGNCHIHDFQAFSHVLLGTIKEEMYSVSQMSPTDSHKYHMFLQRIHNKSKLEQDSINSVLENLLIGIKDSNLILEGFCDAESIDVNLLAQWHTFYVGKRRILPNGQTIESFEIGGDYSFVFKDHRSISEGESYFLPVDQGHRIVTEGETVTFFATDTTYKHGALPENNFSLINGHGKRFPWKQKNEEKRHLGGYSLGDEEIFSNIKRISGLILDKLN